MNLSKANGAFEGQHEGQNPSHLSAARFQLRPNHGLLDGGPHPDGGSTVGRRVHLQPDQGLSDVVHVGPGDSEDERLPLGQLGAADLHVQEGVVDGRGRGVTSPSSGSELLR